MIFSASFVHKMRGVSLRIEPDRSKNRENRRFSTLILKNTIKQDRGTVLCCTMPLFFYSVTPKCDSPF